MLILILSYLRANELTIAVNHCNGPNQGKIEIIIGSKQSIFLNLSQLTSVNLLSSFITTPKKLIQNISKIIIAYNLNNTIASRQYHQIYSILFYYILQNLSKDITNLEFNIQQKIAFDNYNILLLQIISNLVKFTELNNLSITMNKLFSLEINLPNFLNDYYISSIGMIIPVIQQELDLKNQLIHIHSIRISKFLETSQKDNNQNETEKNMINNLFNILLNYSKPDIDSYSKNIVNCYNNNSYKVIIFKSIIVEYNPIDSALLFLEISEFLDQALFNKYNTSLFSFDSNLN